LINAKPNAKNAGKRECAPAWQNIIDACALTHAHLVHVSTDFIFDGTYGPLDESAIPNPVNFYGESKLAGEKLIQQSSKLAGPYLRTVLVYGVTPDMSRSNIVLWVKKSLEAWKNNQCSERSVAHTPRLLKTWLWVVTWRHLKKQKASIISPAAK
jgi:dTDP-4-dehydrorhamnose reductase